MSKIALLSTGDEVVEGEILNTNSQSLAEIITEQGYEIGRHIVCRDLETEIKTCIDSLLAEHQCVIVTGGLGPTADDRTRFAVAKLINQPLVFHAPTWRWLEERYMKLNIAIPETNRQQAMFPKNSEILFNENGSADGCFLEYDNKIIIMLPGPPNECIPILKNLVIPKLKKFLFASLAPLLKWRLFNISESLLAEKINHSFKDISSNVGYRWHYPYIDVKYRERDLDKAKKIKQNLDDFFKENIICPVDSTASRSLKKIIGSYSRTIKIDDQVSGGLLQTLILSPSTCGKLSFGIFDENFKGLQISLNGLKEYWQQKDNQTETDIVMTIVDNEKKMV